LETFTKQNDDKNQPVMKLLTKSDLKNFIIFQKFVLKTPQINVDDYMMLRKGIVFGRKIGKFKSLLQRR